MLLILEESTDLKYCFRKKKSGNLVTTGLIKLFLSYVKIFIPMSRYVFHILQTLLNS